jgi:hypothetical protein
MLGSRFAGLRSSPPQPRCHQPWTPKLIFSPPVQRRLGFVWLGCELTIPLRVIEIVEGWCADTGHQGRNWLKFGREWPSTEVENFTLSWEMMAEIRD